MRKLTLLLASTAAALYYRARAKGAEAKYNLPREFTEVRVGINNDLQAIYAEGKYFTSKDIIQCDSVHLAKLSDGSFCVQLFNGDPPTVKAVFLIPADEVLYAANLQEVALGNYVDEPEKCADKVQCADLEALLRARQEAELKERRGEVNGDD